MTQVARTLGSPPRSDLAATATREVATYLRVVRYQVTSPETHPASRYDVALRDAQDAAVIVPFCVIDGVTYVTLRSAPRVPLIVAQHECTTLWELPAGLIEPGETPDAAAARELLEEIGTLPLSLVSLGPPSYPSPGVLAERHYLFVAEVTPPPWPTRSPADDPPAHLGAGSVCAWRPCGREN
jgi:ADP-ribose pyrophosphatase